MAFVVGRTWSWLRSWASYASNSPTQTVVVEQQKPKGDRYLSGWTSWIWRGWKRQRDCSGPKEEFWEAQEKLQPMEIEDVGAGKPETETNLHISRGWSRFSPFAYFWPPKTDLSALRKRKAEVDGDGDFSDYGTPPPSPTPSKLTSPFRFFAHSWNVEIHPEHYEICFNFLRHLFDLCVVALLWTVSHPAKFLLEMLGMQGALRLWFHGMAMFLVSTVGMAGLFWVIQEYLPQFALIYGIVQALVISVSVRQSVILGEDDKEDGTKNLSDTPESKDGEEYEKLLSKNTLKTSLS